MIWTGGKEALNKFFEIVNQLHASIKFEFKYSKEQIDFLDTTVHITPEKTLSTALHRKPTDRNAYLHFNSYHPLQQKKNIPFGQFLRAKKISSTSEKEKESLLKIKDKFASRRYPKGLLDEQLGRTETITRQDLLVEKKKQEGNLLPFTTTFNKNPPQHKRNLGQTLAPTPNKPKTRTSIHRKPNNRFQTKQKPKGPHRTNTSV